MDEKKQIIIGFFTDLLGEEPEIEIFEEEDGVYVNLQVSPELSGIIIGYRGEVLTATQFVVSMMLSEKDGWSPVRLNINNYREQRSEALETLAINTANRVLDSGQALSIPNLSSYERRQVHDVITGIEGVTSFSEGSGRNRTLIIDLEEAE